MKRRILNILMAIVVLSLNACKKDPLPELPDQNNPYYTIKGLIDGDSLDLSVGVDNVTIIKGTSEFNGLKTYYGRLNAPEENLSIKIEMIRPELTYSANGFKPLSSGEYNLIVNEPGCITMKFGNAYSQYNYFLVKNENNNFVSTDEIEFSEYGIYDLTVKFTDYEAPTGSYVIPVKFGFEDQDLISGFQSFGNLDTVMIFAFNEEGDHEWYIDGKIVGYENIYIGQMEDGIHEVRHRITDIYGNTSEHFALIRFRNGEYYWQMNYNYCDLIPDENHYGNIIITVEKDGQIYTTSKALSNKENRLAIDNIEFVNDQSNDISWAIYDFAFDAVLLNENQTDSLSLSGISGTFNMGLK